MKPAPIQPTKLAIPKSANMSSQPEMGSICNFIFMGSVLCFRVRHTLAQAGRVYYRREGVVIGFDNFEAKYAF